jgi:TIR domain
MFTLTMNGKPFDPDEFQKALMAAAVEKVREHVHEQLSSIRHPETDEFPVVQVVGTEMDNLAVRIEGSSALLSLVRDRLSPEDLESVSLIETSPDARPKVFLSFGWEDRDLAKRIAETLMANGVDTWWAEWEIGAGDSLRRKIDEGLSNCTVFLVLLTPTSITKPWVNQEMDAGLMQKLQARARFMPVRKDLPTTALPPLLSGMYSPELQDFEKDIQQLILNIHNVSRKPPLGPSPPAADRTINTGYSSAATAIAKVFVETTKDALYFDPTMSVHGIGEATGLSEDDIADALHELGSMIKDEYDIITGMPELYATFDKHFRPWNPAADALRVAADFVNDSSFPEQPVEIAARYGWKPRRLNPALSYLIRRKLLDAIEHLGMNPWVAGYVHKNDATRRFVKSRA